MPLWGREVLSRSELPAGPRENSELYFLRGNVLRHPPHHLLRIFWVAASVVSQKRGLAIRAVIQKTALKFFAAVDDGRLGIAQRGATPDIAEFLCGLSHDLHQPPARRPVERFEKFELQRIDVAL